MIKLNLNFSLHFNLPFIYWSWIEYKVFKVFFSLSVTYLKRQQVQQNCTFRRFIALQVKYVVPRDLRKHLLWQKPLLETSYNNPFILAIVILLWHLKKSSISRNFHFSSINRFRKSSFCILAALFVFLDWWRSRFLPFFGCARFGKINVIYRLIW